MKKLKYGYDDLRNFLIIIGIMAVVSYFVLYVISHWEHIITFLQAHSQAEVKLMMSQLRSKTMLNVIILILLTSVTAAIPFMSNAIFAIFNGVVYGPGIGFLMNIVSNILGNFIFIKILKRIDITDSELKWKNYFSGIDILKNTSFGIILGYMIPVMPTLLVNYYVAEMKLSWHKWFIDIIIGIAPSSLIYALGGDAVVVGNHRRVIALLVILFLVYLTVAYVKKRNKKLT